MDKISPMTQTSNIRLLLTNPQLGLLPLLDTRLEETEKSLQEEEISFKFEPYDFQFGDCKTISANEPRPFITQAILFKLFITGSAKDKFELLLIASELQNTVDAAIFEWGSREWHQFDKPMKRHITQITGGLDYELLTSPAKSCRISIYREFDLIYPVVF